METGVLRGNLDLLLLAVLAREPGHGYAIIEQLRRRSDAAFDLPEGSVYPALHRLETGGLLDSHWTVEAGRRRRVYALTARGREALAARTEEWRGFSRAVSAVLGGAS